MSDNILTAPTELIEAVSAKVHAIDRITSLHIDRYRGGAIKMHTTFGKFEADATFISERATMDDSWSDLPAGIKATLVTLQQQIVEWKRSDGDLDAGVNG